MSELIAQAEALEWAAREAKCSNYIDMSRRCFDKAAKLRAQAEQPASDWQHLKAFGYAPGDYMNKCLRCGAHVGAVDKRATSCRPCAEKAFAAAKQPAEPATLSTADVIIAILAVDREAARRGEMFPQTHDEQREDRRAVARVVGMLRWYQENTGCERIKGWPTATSRPDPRIAALGEK